MWVGGAIITGGMTATVFLAFAGSLAALLVLDMLSFGSSGGRVGIDGAARTNCGSYQVSFLLMAFIEINFKLYKM